MPTDGSLPLSESSSSRPRVPRALDGEVIPPTIRIPRPEASEPAAEAPKAPPPSFRLRLSTAIAAGLAVVAVSSATLAGIYTLTAHRGVAKPDATTVALNHLQDDLSKLKAGVDTLHPAADLARQDDAVRGLKKSVDGLKAELDALRSNNTAALGQLSAKIEKGDPSAKIADVMARIDKLDRDPSPKLAEITARLDRIERQVSSQTPTGSISAPAKQIAVPQPQPIAAPASEKPLPRPATLDSWVVRDVYDGIALVEGRQGGIREVTPGEFLPGAGEVRSIERRGRAWIVVTSRGIIDNSTW